MAGGSHDAGRRANGPWKRMLADYEDQAPTPDPALDEGLKDFMAKKK